MFSLDNRLMMCAGLTRPGARLADIGTDHALLPVWLKCRGLISAAIACDIGEQPLKNAADTTAKYCPDIQLRLCDGLAAVSGDEVDDIVIAGMGGDTIVSIIENAPWLRNSRYRLILQPMTKCERLILWLYDNGFELKEQKTCRDGDKLYTALLVAFSNTFGCSELFTYTGLLNPKHIDSDRDYLLSVARYLEKKAAGDQRYLSLANQIKEGLTS